MKNPSHPPKQTSHKDVAAQKQLVQLLTDHQTTLLSYIRASVRDLATAKDILQKVNLIIWEKAADFQPGSNFIGWALRIAKFQILGHFRDHQRDPLVFSENTLDQFATELETIDQKWRDEKRLQALEICLEKLPAPQRELLTARYEKQDKIKDLATSLNRSQSSIKMTLLRARQSLLDCIQKTPASS